MERATGPPTLFPAGPVEDPFLLVSTVKTSFSETIGRGALGDLTA